MGQTPETLETPAIPCCMGQVLRPPQWCSLLGRGLSAPFRAPARALCAAVPEDRRGPPGGEVAGKDQAETHEIYKFICEKILEPFWMFFFPVFGVVLISSRTFFGWEKYDWTSKHSFLLSSQIWWSIRGCSGMFMWAFEWTMGQNWWETGIIPAVGKLTGAQCRWWRSGSLRAAWESSRFTWVTWVTWASCVRGWEAGRSWWK